MDFALNEEQRALQATVRSYLRDRFDLAAVRAVFDDPEGSGDPDDLWKASAEQGWLAALVPEDNDGIGLGLLDASVIARALGAGAAPGPWLPTVLAGEAVRLGGSAAQRAAVLPGLAAGETRAAVALRREGGSWTPAGIGVTATDGTLSGTAASVDYAHVAAVLVVAAREGDEVGLYLVDPSASGLTVVRQEALDRTTRVCSVVLEGAAGERLEASSAEVYADLVQRAAVLAANDLAGIAREALSRTVAYDRDRVQFGKPVGSFQAIKHALADLHVGVTMAEHASLYAAHAVDAGTPDAALAVSIAKAKCSDAAKQATAAMVQYHGGIGYTWEHEAHFFYKRARRLAYAFGDSIFHKERVAQLFIDVRAARQDAASPPPALEPIQMGPQ